MLDYALLEALLAVEREGSFEGAARSLGMTSSAISQRIKLLEQRIGAITVNRQVPVTPTEFGMSLCRHTERVMFLEHSIIKENENQFLSYQTSKKHLKILVNDDSLSSWFIDVLQAEAKCRNPFLYELEIADQDHSLSQMKSGSALAAISSSKKAAQGFRSVYLGDHVYRATASNAFYQRYFSRGVSLETIQVAPALRYSSQDDLQKQWVLQAFQSDAKLNGYILPSVETLVSACLKDIAWGLSLDIRVDEYIRSGELVELVPGEVLHKPLYWHCSLAVYDQMKGLTDKVVAAAKIQLHQNSKTADRASPLTGTYSV